MGNHDHDSNTGFWEELVSVIVCFLVICIIIGLAHFIYCWLK